MTGKQKAAAVLCMVTALAVWNGAPVFAGTLQKNTRVRADAMRLFEDAEKRNAALDSCAFDFTLSTQRAAGQSGSSEAAAPLLSTGQLKAMNAGTDQFAFTLSETAERSGQTLSHSSFYTGNELYYRYTAADTESAATVLDSGKKKAAVPAELLGAALLTAVDPGSAEVSSITDMTMKKSGEETVLTYTADPSKMSFQALVGIRTYLSLFSVTELPIDYLETAVTAYSAAVKLNADGYYTEKKVDITFADPETQGGTVRSVMDAVITEPGKPVSVELPSVDGYSD